jgi:ABC-type transporter Mla subunit MlaD
MKRNASDVISALLVLFCSVVLLGALTFALSGYRVTDPGRKVEIDFADVTGVRMHSEVRYAGAPAGSVIAIRHLTREERAAATEEKKRNAVRVTVELLEDVPELPQDVEASLTSETMLSEKFVALSAGSPDVPRLADGIVLQGRNSGSLDEVFGAVGPALKAVEQTLASLQPIVDKAGQALDAIKDGVNDAIPRISEVADSTKGVADTAEALLMRTDRLIAENEGEIKANLQELRGSLESVQKVLGSADSMLGKTDRELAARMKELSVVLQNLKVATTHAKALTETLGEKPSRLIWGSKRNQLTPEPEILRNSRPVPARREPARP